MTDKANEELNINLTQIFDNVDDIDNDVEILPLEDDMEMELELEPDEEEEEELPLEDFLGDLADPLAEEEELELELEPEEMSLEKDIDSFGEMNDNSTTRESMDYHDIESDIESLDEYKEYVIKQLKLEVYAEDTYIKQVLDSKFKSNEELIDELRKNKKLLNPENTIDGVFAVQDYMLWSRTVNDDILSGDKDEDLALQFMQYNFKTNPNKCKGFSLPITPYKMYKNTTLTQLRLRLLELFDMTRKEAEVSKRRLDRRFYLLKQNSAAIEERLSKKSQLINDMEQSVVVPTKEISYESNIKVNINRNMSYNTANEDIRFSCGHCGREVKGNHLFHQINIYNHNISKSKITVTPYKLDKYKQLNKDGTFRVERDLLSNVLNVFFPVCQCEECGAYNSIPVSSMNKLQNYASKIQKELSMFQDKDIATEMDSRVLGADVLADQLKGIVNVKYKFKDVQVIDNNEITIAHIENDIDALTQQYKDTLAKFRVVEKALADKDFEFFSLVKYVTNSSQNGNIDMKVFFDYIGKTINAICNTQLFKTSQLSINKLKNKVSATENVINNYTQVTNLFSCLENNVKVNTLRKIPMSAYNDYFRLICAHFSVPYTPMFETETNYAYGEVSQSAKQLMQDVYETQVKDLASEQERLNKAIRDIQDNLRNAKLFEYLLADDFSPKADNDLLEVLGDTPDTHQFIKDVFKQCLCNTLYTELISHFATTNLSKRVKKLLEEYTPNAYANFVKNTLSVLPKDLASEVATNFPVQTELSKVSTNAKELCKAIASKNYIRVCRILQEDSTLQNKLDGDYFNISNVSEDISKYGIDLAEVMLEFSGVGFDLAELQEYFIHQGHELKEQANYTKRLDGESLQDYLKRLESTDTVPIDKPFENVFLKAYNANTWLEHDRLACDFSTYVVKDDLANYLICNGFINVIKSNMDLADKLRVLRVDLNFYRNLCYSDLAFDLNKEFESTLAQIRVDNHNLGEYLKTVYIASQRSEQFERDKVYGLLDVYSTLSEDPETYAVLDDFIHYAEDVLAQLPKEVEEKYPIECEQMNRIILSHYV